MTTRKKRILFVGETACALSGFGTYHKEILSRLHNSGKYEIAELAVCCYVDDPRLEEFQWKIYPNGVRPNDPRHKDYTSKKVNEMGAWRLERVLLDFLPDIVVDIRDPFMFSFEHRTPLRDYYHWCIMPTVDSAPQKISWIDMFISADSVMTYSDWGAKILKEEGNGKINLCGVTTPGVDLKVFSPAPDKKQHRTNFGIDPNLNIIGTAMRNQRRKLFPDLFLSFSKYLEECRKNGRDDLVESTYLYCHTSYPEKAGWDFPRLLKEFGLGHKVMFTYICQDCKHVFASFFSGSRCICPKCKKLMAALPSVSVGLSREQLSDVYNCFDLYVQYACAEGFGIPLVEAASCGVPTMAVDYSAMEDTVRRTKGTPIKVKAMFRELESHAYRALPDHDDTAKKFYNFMIQPYEMRRQQERKTRDATESYYNWDRIAKIWIDHFDSIEIEDKWSKPPKLFKIPENIPDNLNNNQFVQWLFNSVLHKPEWNNTLFSTEILQVLDCKANMEGRVEPIERATLFNKFTSMAKNIIMCERCRTGSLELTKEDYIDYANRQRQ